MTSLTSLLRAHRFATTWAVVCLLVVTSFVLARQATRPAPDREAGRAALATAGSLQDLGVRTVGNKALSDGLDLVARDLKAIPGIEVARQDASGTYRFHDRDVAYTVENVIARQQGDIDDALLVNVHIDSAFEGVGAADDAVAAGAVIQAARQLAGDDRHRTVIYLFNGGEEVGLTGADAFTRHLWAKNVRWFLNLEAVGSAGLPILFQAGEDDGKLIGIAGNTPRPSGSILGQWLFGAGLINSDTDSRVWRGEGWSGLDYAVFEDGYAYHTPLDRVERIGPGVAQALTDLTTQVARDITSAPDVGAKEASPYYVDVLSRAWVTLDPLVMKIWTLVLLLASAALTWRARRTWGTGTGHVVAWAGAALLGVLLAVLAGGLAGGAEWLLGGSHAWYAQPWLVYVVLLPLALLGALLPQLLLHRRRARRAAGQEGAAVVDGPRTALLANASALAVLGVVTAWLEVGPAYILWAAATVMLAAIGCAMVLRGAWRALPLVVGAFVLCVLIAQFAHNLLGLAVPMMGRLPTAIAMDPVLGVVAAVVAVPLALVFAPFVFYAGHPRRYVYATAAITACGLLIAGLSSPYDAEHPKLVSAFHEQRDGEDARIMLEGRDYHTPQDMGLLDRVAEKTGMSVREDALAAPKADVPAAAVDFEAAGPTEPVTVRIGANEASLVRITVTGPGLSVDGRPFEGTEAVLDVVGRSKGHTATIERTGPVKITVDQVFLRTGRAVEQVLAALPDWAVGHGRTVIQRTYADPQE
ncbi:M28 family peptidase [Streptomyces sp. NPDC058620]|uniref:M28 family peptidase n=1 Tax=Streptomyces sp. NPDC058620 TaxID=3346560 RepID=UPI003655CCCB